MPIVLEYKTYQSGNRYPSFIRDRHGEVPVETQP